MGEQPQVGVFICHCGGNISNTVDVAKVRDEISKIDGVKVAETYEYVCSSPGQELIKQAIKEQGVNRVVVASCSPRMHLETFRKAAEEAGLNPYQLEMANIREQCSWVHNDKVQATEKATDIVRGSIERAKHLEPLEPEKMKVNRSALIVGAGIAGIVSALEIGDKGYQVYLVDRSPSIGGHMAQLSKTFPTMDCSSCTLAPRMVQVASHPNIKVITLAEPIAMRGTPGNYIVTLRKLPRFVDEARCTACGECAKYCPSKVGNEFEAGLTQRKAIYIPFAQAVPNKYAIDSGHCLYLSKGICRICERFCRGKAIDFEQKEEVLDISVGSVILSIGYEQIDPATYGNYSYGLHPDIITNLQYERLMIQGIHRPSDGKVPKKVAFVTCVGSRCSEEIGQQFCCKIGCMNAIKEAVLLDKSVPGANPWVFYTDVRAHGKGYEEFYADSRNTHNVKFVRGRVAEIVPNGGKIIVRAEDTLLAMQVEEEFDMVVLQAALVAPRGTKDVAQIFSVPVGHDGFLLERHHKLRPVDTSKDGIYACGCVLGPKDIRETTLEAMATASKVATFVGKGEILASPKVARVDSSKCNGCGVCLGVCPTKAIDKHDGGIIVNAISCNGCGLCVPQCPLGVLDLNHCTEAQLLAQIEGISKGGTTPKVVVFLEEETPYASVDLAGQTRLSYASNVEIIPVPSVGRVGVKHLLRAFASGADGIALVEGDDGPLRGNALRDYVAKLKKAVAPYGIAPSRIMSTSTTIPQYDKLLNFFEMLTKNVTNAGKVPGEAREKICKTLEEAS